MRGEWRGVFGWGDGKGVDGVGVVDRARIGRAVFRCFERERERTGWRWRVELLLLLLLQLRYWFQNRSRGFALEVERSFRIVRRLAWSREAVQIRP